MTTTADVLTQNLCEAWQVTCMVAAGTLSGGVTASMAGGSFWEGVCNGLICSGLNHALHLAVGPLNKGLAIAMVTGRIRHMFGPYLMYKAAYNDTIVVIKDGFLMKFKMPVPDSVYSSKHRAKAK